MARTIKKNADYWEGFYKKLSLKVPSQFCAMVATEAEKDRCIVELGCGNGRDSLYFSSSGFSVYATDQSKEAIMKCVSDAKERGLIGVEFILGDISDAEFVAGLFNQARINSPTGNVTGYSRFVIHSITDDQEDTLLSAVADAMRPGEKIFFEFRSKEDAELEKTFGNHYRRFVDTDVFVETMTQRHGFKNHYRITGQGMARYKNEDPFVSRLIFEKS